MAEHEIEACRKQAVAALSGIGAIEGQDSVDIPEEKILNAGNNQLIVSIGDVKIASRRRKFVVKLWRFPERQADPKRFSTLKSDWSTILPLEDESLAQYLRSKGFPVPVHHAIGEVMPGVCATVTENLGQVEEADGFDFKKLKNGANLKSQYKHLVSRLFEMKRRDVIDGRHHNDEAIPKAFGIIINEKETGTLVVSDIRNMKLKTNANEEDPDYDRALRKYHFLIAALYPGLEDMERKKTQLKQTLQEITRQLAAGNENITHHELVHATRLQAEKAGSTIRRINNQLVGLSKINHATLRFKQLRPTTKA